MQDELYQTAIDRLTKLMAEAWALNLAEANVAALATAGSDARPSVRMIHIQGVADDHFIFFANSNSGKAIQLAQNPHASLCFYWPQLHEQVIVDGEIEAQPDDVSDHYWPKRARESQLMAWASQQGSPADEKGDARERLRSLRSRSGFSPVKRHQDWQAYRVFPNRIEFWSTGSQRSRERVRYYKSDTGSWTSKLINA